jgi:hypothetical protein
MGGGGGGITRATMGCMYGDGGRKSKSSRIGSTLAAIPNPDSDSDGCS